MIYAKIKGMAIVPANRREYAMFLEDNEGKDILIKRTTGTRSDPQNSYYWGVVLKTISLSTGHTENELHEVFKRMFLTPITVKYKDREIRMPGSTAKLNKSEFVEYIMRISAEAGSMGITIPEPEKDEPVKVEYPELKEQPAF